MFNLDKKVLYNLAEIHTSRGNYYTVMGLLDLGTPIHKTKIYEHVKGLLSIACGKGRVGLVKELLKRGAKPGEDGGQAMMSASDGGHYKVLELLVAAGGDVNCCNGACLSFAARASWTKTVKYLLKQGACPTANNYLALAYAIEEWHIGIVSLILETIPDNHLWPSTLLTWTKECSIVEIVAVLEEKMQK
jgi:hypothetical protein